MTRKLRVPAQVLERLASASSAKKPVVPTVPKTRALLPREKVVAALKKLHPMD
jgi:hypothetical protein